MEEEGEQIQDDVIVADEADSSENTHHKTCSEVWKFFERKGNRTVECMLCHSNLAYHGGTSSMKEHLKRKHPADNPTEDGYKQRKLDVFAKKRSCSSERVGAISEQIVMMIVKDLRPISIVNGKGFQQLIRFLEPDYRLPLATHLTHLIENRYKVEKQKVHDIINSKSDYIAITADIWTRMATESYLTMTVHYQWQMKSLISGTMPLSESHILYG